MIFGTPVSGFEKKVKKYFEEGSGWTLPSDRPANRVQKTEMSVQDWA